jgi:hypothetical protein
MEVPSVQTWHCPEARERARRSCQVQTRRGNVTWRPRSSLAASAAAAILGRVAIGPTPVELTRTARDRTATMPRRGFMSRPPPTTTAARACYSQAVPPGGSVTPAVRSIQRLSTTVPSRVYFNWTRLPKSLDRFVGPRRSRRRCAAIDGCQEACRRPAFALLPNRRGRWVREREVQGLVASGLGNQEIGDRLGLAEKTIEQYMTNILGKLHVRSRVEAGGGGESFRLPAESGLRAASERWSSRCGSARASSS